MATVLDGEIHVRVAWGETFRNTYSLGLGTRFTDENMYSSSLRKRFTCENTYSHDLWHILRVKIRILAAWGPANMFI